MPSSLFGVEIFVPICNLFVREAEGCKRVGSHWILSDPNHVGLGLDFFLIGFGLGSNFGS